MTLTCLLSFSVYADNTDTGIESTVIANENEEGGVLSSNNEGNLNTTDGNNENNFFTSLYKAFEVNISEILSSLAFIGSLIVMLSYKKGFIPIFEGGIRTLLSNVKNIDEKADKLTQNAEERIKYAESTVAMLSDTVSKLEEKVKRDTDTRVESEKIKNVLLCEIEMLYDVFMAAALPQYLKDRVGERVAIMKSLVEAEEKNEEG